MMMGSSTSTSTTQGRSCSWGIPVILLLVTLEGAFLWMDRFGGTPKEMFCGKDIQKNAQLLVQGGSYHHTTTTTVAASASALSPVSEPSNKKSKKPASLRKTNTTMKAPVVSTVVVDDLPVVFEGVCARPFSYNNNNNTLPCYPPEQDWKGQAVQTTPTTTGFIFLKPYKTGSSTSSGVMLRMARNVAKRRNNNNNNQQASAQQAAFDICASRFDHAIASDMYAERDAAKSILWTVIRSPKERIVSAFFHFRVSRHKMEPTDAAFLEFVRDPVVGNNVRDYYLHALSLERYRQGASDAVAIANGILRDYDFIGITERMDESVVALSMVLNLPLADVLYLKAKGKGGFDDGGGRDGGKICTYIWPSFVSQGMQDFFETDEWKQIIHWDSVVYQAANRSLDLTIDKLGRGAFEKKLEAYMHAKDVVRERCLPRTTFPCSIGGKFNHETDCLWNDSGCGNECMDEVSTELDLW